MTRRAKPRGGRYSPLAHWIGFVPMPATVLGALALATIAYLVAVYGAKRWFFKRYHPD